MTSDDTWKLAISQVCEIDVPDFVSMYHWNGSISMLNLVTQRDSQIEIFSNINIYTYISLTETLVKVMEL